MSRLHRLLLLPVAALAALLFQGVAAADHLAVDDTFRHTGNMHAIGFSPRGNTPAPFTANSDLAFWKHLAFQGHYDGFRIIDIADPDRARRSPSRSAWATRATSWSGTTS